MVSLLAWESSASPLSTSFYGYILSQNFLSSFRMFDQNWSHLRNHCKFSTTFLAHISGTIEFAGKKSHPTEVNFNWRPEPSIPESCMLGRSHVRFIVHLEAFIWRLTATVIWEEEILRIKAKENLLAKMGTLNMIRCRLKSQKMRFTRPIHWWVILVVIKNLLRMKNSKIHQLTHFT